MSLQRTVLLALSALGLTGAAYYGLASSAAHPEKSLASSQVVKTAAKRVHRPLQAMSPQEVNHFLADLPRDPVQRIEQVSAQALGTPYFLGPLGEGPEAPYDKKPLINLQQVDCVTFCEQTLALALSHNYEDTVQTLQKIRYKNGEIKMECRNHYTLADWTVNNQWLMDDITPRLPGHQWLTRTISHQKLFAMQKFEGIQVREPDRVLKAAYIPEDAIEKVLPQLRSGDMAVLIQDQPGIFAAHTGFMIRKNDQWVFRNATSLQPKQVVDTPLPVLLTSLKQSKRLIGMSFVRPRPEAFGALQKDAS